jgi:hypothetical protein
MAHEGQLWEMALEPFGSDELLQVVLDMWKDVGPPPKPVVEHLTTKQVGQDVLPDASQASISCGPYSLILSTSWPALSQ